jgi:hypothetical protein
MIFIPQVSPFELSDPSKPGHRKILVFFLIDPTHIIPSATTVPPRQPSVVRHILREQGPGSRLSTLPLEILDTIAGMVPGVMDRHEAESIKDELMAERSVFVKKVDGEYFGRVRFITFQYFFAANDGYIIAVRYVVSFSALVRRIFLKNDFSEH